MRTPQSLVEQALRGHPLGTPDGVRCAGCCALVGEGEPCTVYVCRLDGEGRFDVPRLWCAGCAPTDLSPGRVERYLVEGTVGHASDVTRQACWLALVEPEVADADGHQQPDTSE